LFICKKTLNESGGIIIRRPTLYKQRGTWYARFWNTKEKKYHSRALGIPVEGKRERRQEAEEAARIIAADIAQKETEILQPVNQAATIPLIEYALAFWQSDGEYAREKALVEKEPLSAQYLLSSRLMVKTKMKPFPGFADITLNGLTKLLIRRWKLWMAEQGYSGRMINGAMLALPYQHRRGTA
jgi:hypothetical protein